MMKSKKKRERERKEERSNVKSRTSEKQEGRKKKREYIIGPVRHRRAMGVGSTEKKKEADREDGDGWGGKQEYQQGGGGGRYRQTLSDMIRIREYTHITAHSTDAAITWGSILLCPSNGVLTAIEADMPPPWTGSEWAGTDDGYACRWAWVDDPIESDIGEVALRYDDADASPADVRIG